MQKKIPVEMGSDKHRWTFFFGKYKHRWTDTVKKVKNEKNQVEDDDVINLTC